MDKKKTMNEKAKALGPPPMYTKKTMMTGGRGRVVPKPQKPPP